MHEMAVLVPNTQRLDGNRIDQATPITLGASPGTAALPGWGWAWPNSWRRASLRSMHPANCMLSQTRGHTSTPPYLDRPGSEPWTRGFCHLQGQRWPRASVGWQALSESAKDSIRRIFLNIFVAGKNLAS